VSDAVIVLEDDPVVRRGIVEQLERSARFSVVAQSPDVAGARHGIENGAAVAGVFDLELRDGSSLPLIPLAVERGMNVLVLTVWDDERVYQALEAGAGGYLLKSDASAGRVAEALTVLLEGGAPISPMIARRLLEDLRLRSPKKAGPPTPDISRLTEREREIIELFAKGATYEEVGSLLAVSINTVRHHVRNMYRKLHVCSKAEAVTLAYSKA
jgi:DNA-binding NarL/FixJ family response regulator